MRENAEQNNSEYDLFSRSKDVIHRARFQKQNKVYIEGENIETLFKKNFEAQIWSFKTAKRHLIGGAFFSYAHVSPQLVSLSTNFRKFRFNMIRKT